MRNERRRRGGTRLMINIRIIASRGVGVGLVKAAKRDDAIRVLTCRRGRNRMLYLVKPLWLYTVDGCVQLQNV